MITSPCVSCCKLNSEKVCIGCYRHITQIVDWNKRSQAELATIMQQVAARKVRYEKQDLSQVVTSPITQAEWLAAKKTLNR